MSYTEIAVLLGVLAGLLQFIGYVFYIKDEEIKPEPTTWFMFAYGTAILTILEIRAAAHWYELMLPIVCSIMAIYVSFKCWQRSREKDPSSFWPKDWWPEDTMKRISFVSDMIITVCYLAIVVVVATLDLNPVYQLYAALGFLFLSNSVTFTAFIPILKETQEKPTNENWRPWAIWTAAYAVLTVSTALAPREAGDSLLSLLFYPASNTILHAAVGWLARPAAQTLYRAKLVAAE